MVNVFGNNIVNAFTGGNPVKAIYSNGVKVWPIEKPLPEGYTRMNYIYGSYRSNGPGILIKDIYWDDTFRLIVDIERDSSEVSKSMDLFGYDTGSYKEYSMVNYNDNGVVGINSSYRLAVSSVYNSAAGQTTFWDINTRQTISSGRHLVELNNNEIKIDGTVYGTRTRTSPTTRNTFITFLNTTNRYTYNGGSAPWGQGNSTKWYGAKIMMGNSLMMDLVPVRNESDGTYGFYDLENDKFYGKDEKSVGIIRGA